jgi:preprotein translocase subunit SecA
MLNQTAEKIVEGFSNESNKEALLTEIKIHFGIDNVNVNTNPEDMISEIKERALAKYEQKESEIGETEMRELERVVMLKVVDQKWMDHIDAMDELKDGIGLRAYGQKDPVVQYRMEGFDMFDQMIEDIKVDVVKILMNVEKKGEAKRTQTVRILSEKLQSVNEPTEIGPNNVKVNNPVSREPVVNNGPKIGRNDPCPCGSGKKYKNCCGK